jgi:hypothetical protein
MPLSSRHVAPMAPSISDFSTPPSTFSFIKPKAGGIHLAIYVASRT